MKSGNKGGAPCHTSSGTSPGGRVPETKTLHSLKASKAEAFVPQTVRALALPSPSPPPTEEPQTPAGPAHVRAVGDHDKSVPGETSRYLNSL